jgi:DNA repair protein RadD
MTFVERAYQQEALQAIPDFISNGYGDPLCVIPTGGGKSYVIAKMIRDFMTQWPETRIMVLAHVPELIAQNFAELVGFWPAAPAGIYSAKLGVRQIGARVLFAGIQSVHRRAYEIQQCDVCIVDEAHLIPRAGNTMYLRLLADLKTINSHMVVIGFTATHFRLDSGMLHEGDGAMFSGIAYEASVARLIREGWLIKPVPKSGATQIDTSRVGTVAGEFNQQQLEAVSNDPATVAKIADETCEAGQNRAGWLVFGAGVKNATLMCKALRERGVEAEAIFGSTPKTERNAIISAFKRREIRALVSMGVLTTGFNAQHVDLLSIPRATKSVGLYIQIIGRGMRCLGSDATESAANGKTDCLVLDFGGNIQRHGPIDNPNVPHKKASKKDKPKAKGYKICPACNELNAPVARQCLACGYAFPEFAQFISTEAGTGDIISGQERADMLRYVPEWVEVKRVEYVRHVKAGKPDSLRVIYGCGIQSYREWVFIEGDERQRGKAAAWWRLRVAPGSEIPRTVTQALQASVDLAQPAQIAVRRQLDNAQYWEVVGHRYFTPDYQSRAAA